LPELPQTLLVVVAIAAYGALAFLTWRMNGAPPASIDRAMQARVLERKWPYRTIGVLMSGPGYAGACFGITGLLIWYLRRHGGQGQTTLAIACIGGWATHRTIKLFLKRRRPDSRKGYGHEFESFPSGHTTITASTALASAYVFATQGFIPTWLGVVIAIGFPVVIGAGRVVADEHWTTDVLGGLAGGIGMACVAILSSRA
jgi:membrane-associated phospholipid phosphatase